MFYFIIMIISPRSKQVSKLTSTCSYIVSVNVVLIFVNFCCLSYHPQKIVMNFTMVTTKTVLLSINTNLLTKQNKFMDYNNSLYKFSDDNMFSQNLKTLYLLIKFLSRYKTYRLIIIYLVIL